MPGTKDPFSEATTAALADHDAQQLPASSAAGAEIPVTVHASRYSAASKGGGKLPPVHEETRTVIILPQGAVVRLSAAVTPGELVVLTNNNTGADVICRVTNVKAQPGIQSYVHLEFTQRALDFWEESQATGGRATAMGKSGMVATPPPVASTPTVARTSISSTQTERSKPAVPAADIKPVPTALPKITPLADAPIGDPMASLAKSLGSSPQVPEAAPAPAATQSQPVAPIRIPRLQPFEASFPQKKNTSTIILFAIAAVVLLVVGAVAGAVLLRRDNGSTTVAAQFSNPSAAPSPAPVAPPAATPAPVPVASKSDAPIVGASPKTSSVNSREVPATVIPAKNTPVEPPLAQPAPVRAAVEPAKPEIAPAPVARPAINVGKISAPRVKKAAQLNSSEPPPILPPDAAVPGAISDAASNPTARANPLLLPAPAAPAPVKGGQLQQPKLLSSVAAVYPPLARTQRVQGDVVIDALIDATGKVAETKVISGNSLLQKAASDSLRQWKYQPAVLNGQPIPVHINVTVVFHLN